MTTALYSLMAIYYPSLSLPPPRLSIKADFMWSDIKCAQIVPGRTIERKMGQTSGEPTYSREVLEPVSQFTVLH